MVLILKRQKALEGISGTVNRQSQLDGGVGIGYVPKKQTTKSNLSIWLLVISEHGSSCKTIFPFF